MFLMNAGNDDSQRMNLFKERSVKLIAALLLIALMAFAPAASQEAGKEVRLGYLPTPGHATSPSWRKSRVISLSRA